MLPSSMAPSPPFLLLLLLVSSCSYLSSAQNNNNTSPSPTNAPSPTALAPISPPPPPPPFSNSYDFCPDGISVLYTFQSLTRGFPNTSNPADQPYAFTASLDIFNAGAEDLTGWEVFIGYVNREILVDAGGALAADGSPFPVNASQGITLTSPSGVLKTGIDTAMDFNQMGIHLDLKGTEFGQSSQSMPNNISLTSPGYSCSEPITSNSTIETCCHATNSSVTLNATSFLPRYKGDITISYDVTQAYPDNYLAQVTISNDNPTISVNFWNLQWTWQNDEYISSMKGAETTQQEQNDCILGRAGTAYPDKDFSQVMSCQSTPTIIDLDAYKANDSLLGQVEYCCRNGSLLSPVQEPSKSKSVFQMQVYKLPPQQLNRTLIDPPVNWKFSGWFDAAYTCGQPRLVEPTEFPYPASALRSTSAVMSWQVTCNVTQLTQSSPRKCCVSYSAFNNNSVIPCPTCACGCTSQQNCNNSAEALLIPVELATVPFVNRTQKTLAWAQLNRWPVPQELPCPDNCGVSINWHLLSQFTNGWSARMTIFNWQGLQFADWSAAVELGKTFPGFEQAYSFNSSLPGNASNNNTIFLYGLSGLNYLNGIYDNYPGLQQSVLSFTLEGVQGNVTARDYFPTKVFFDGNECALPDVLPSGSSGLFFPRLWVVLLLPFSLLCFGPFGLL